MEATSTRGPPMPLHPLNAILLSFPFPMFLGALVTDLAYGASFQVQWINFSSWLIAVGLLFGAFALLWALIGLLRDGAARGARSLAYVVTLAVMWVLSLVNAFVHGKDAWASMPAGLYLSAIAALLAFIAAWMGYSGLPRGFK